MRPILLAGYSEKNLAQSGHQAFETLRLRMPELMDEAGLTAQVLIEKYLVPLLSATTTKFCQYKGKFTDSITVPDNRTRLMAPDMVFKVGGAYTSNESPAVGEPGVRVVILDALVHSVPLSKTFRRSAHQAAAHVHSSRFSFIAPVCRLQQYTIRTQRHFSGGPTKKREVGVAICYLVSYTI
jgi:hypothetical protein